MAGVAELFDGHILNKDDEEVDLNEEEYEGKVIGLYFSADWYVLFSLLFYKYLNFFVLGVQHVVVLLQY